jgi:hypothetical protein
MEPLRYDFVSRDEPTNFWIEDAIFGIFERRHGFVKQIPSTYMKLIDQQSMERDVQRRRQLVWDIDRRLQEDIARPILFLYAKGHVLVASDEGLKITSEQHL